MRAAFKTGLWFLLLVLPVAGMGHPGRPVEYSRYPGQIQDQRSQPQVAPIGAGLDASFAGRDQRSRLQATAATYYVAPPPLGNDSNPGTSAAPWGTIQHAVDAVAAGDTILVRSGTYAGARIESSGTASAWITLKAAPGASVILNTPGPNNRHGSILEVETWEGSGTVAYWIIGGSNAGFEVTGAPNWGIDMRGNDSAKSHHIHIIGNRVHHNGLSAGRTGIFAAFSDDVLVEDNDSYQNGEHGIYINNSSDRFTVRGNRLYQNAGCGVHLNGDLSMGGDGVMADGLIERNIIYNNGKSGGAGVNMDGVRNTSVRNNLLYNNHASGITMYQIDGAICSRDNRIYNNTVLMPSDGRWGVLISGTACTGNQVINNILYSDHAYRGSISLPAASVTGFVSDYNIVVNRFTTDDGESIMTLAQWQALGYDTHSFIGSPAALFVNPASGDYHLKAGSPAIDAGLTLPTVTADLEGNSRPQGSGYDIGAFEYASGPPPQLPLSIYLPLVRK
jgi:parallel beta-helix repeat protein